ncbi:MAG: helix-turn-helix domain-containing protein [Mycobacteriaceae bacterium]|nr:helix-turn-helix domain-containing protein [Mycobacteriaceae bacterium]NBQ44193.1 helix-turn-helix domain-containing protein [Mycobacteriaceae bacterium]
MSKQLTLKELAALWRVDVRTVRRWVEKGAVKTIKTPGGGVRVVVDADK